MYVAKRVIMKTRRALLTLPIALAIVAVAAQNGRADAGPTDSGVADAAASDSGADGGDPAPGSENDDTTTSCGGATPPNAVAAFGAGCC